MKKNVAILILLLRFAISGFAQETYKVISGTAYNIRTAPNTESKIIGNTRGVYSFEVYEIKDGWAKVKHGNDTAFVKSNCLEKAPINKSYHADNEKSQNPGLINYIFSLSFLLFVFSIIRYKRGYLDGTIHYTNWVIYLGIIALEIIGIINTDALLPPVSDTPIWDLIKYILLLAFTAIMQIYSFFKIMDDIQYNFDTSFSVKQGIQYLIGGFIFSIIVGLIWGVGIFFIGVFLTILAQLYFTIKIFITVLKDSNIIIAMSTAGTYLVGLIVTCIITSIVFIVVACFLMVRGYLNAISTTERVEYRYY